MRPPEAWQISMARASAQSECGELSTGTKTSLYGMTPPSAVMGSLKRFLRIAGLLLRLQSELEVRLRPRTSTPYLLRARYDSGRKACQGSPRSLRNDLVALFIPDSQGVDRTARARAQ